jgi:hypothetical protein
MSIVRIANSPLVADSYIGGAARDRKFSDTSRGRRAANFVIEWLSASPFTQLERSHGSNVSSWGPEAKNQ